MYITTIALVAACDIQGAPRGMDHVSLKSRSSGTQELHEISMQVLERLHARGITIEEAEAVVESGNEAAALELLGMDAEEAQELYDRLVAAVERGQSRGSGGSGGSGGRGGGIGSVGDGNSHVNITFGRCRRGYGACLLATGVAGGLTGNPGSGLVVLGVGAFACYCGTCSGGIAAYICF